MSDPLARFLSSSHIADPVSPATTPPSTNTNDPLSQFLGGGVSSNTPNPEPSTLPSNVQGGGADWGNDNTTPLFGGALQNPADPSLGTVSRAEQASSSGLAELMKVPEVAAKFANVLHIPGASEAADYLTNAVAQIQNTGDRPLAGGAVSQFLSKGAGSLVSDALLFGGVSKAISAGAGAAESLMPDLFARSATKIANAAKYAQGIADQLGASPKIADWIGASVGKLPLNLAAGLGFQAITDPEALTEPQGLATTIGSGLIGAGLEGLGSDARNVLRRSNQVEVFRQIESSGLPQYSQNIQEAIHDPAALEPAIPNVGGLWSKIVGAVVNKNKALTDFEKAALKDNPGIGAATPMSEIPSVTAQLNNGTAARIETFTRDAPFYMDYNTGNPVPAEPGVQSFRQVLAQFAPKKVDQDALDRLLLSQRSLDARITDPANPVQLPQVFGSKDATQEIANASPILHQAADGIRSWVQAARQYGENAGVINSDMAMLWDIDNPHYIPLQRLMDTGIIDPGLKPVDNTFGVGNVVKKLFGSARQVLSPLYNAQKFAQTVIKASDRNMVGQQLLNWASNMTESQLDDMGMKILSPADKWSNPEFYDAADKLKDMAFNNMGYVLSDGQAQKVVGSFGKSFDPATSILSVQTQQGVKRLQLSPELATVWQNMTPKAVPIWAKLLGFPANALRTGITSALDFSGANFIRDTFDASLQSKYGFRLGIDSFKGLAESLKNGPARQEWMQAGGGFGDISRAGSINPANPFHSNLPTTALDNVKNVFLHPIDALKEIGRPFEEAARLGEYMRGREQGASAMEAALAARNVTTDFAQRGGSQYMAALSHMTAFLNPSIQSLAKNFDTIEKKPLALLTKGIGAITIPSALLWFANKDDQGIQDLRKTPAGSTQWFFRMPNGGIGKIPKPFLYGQIFGNTIEDGLDKYWAKDPSGLTRLISGITGQAAMNVVPNAVSTYAQLHDNKDWYTGSSIVPQSMEQIDPQFQTLPSTSGLAQYVSGYLNKATGGSVNVSPIHLDWLAKNTFGGIGKDVAGLTRTDPKSLGDQPFFRRFVADYPSMNVEPIQTFYTQADKVNIVAHTIDMLAKKGDAGNLNSYLLAHTTELGFASMYAEGQKQLASVRSTITQIQNAPIDNDTKRNIIKQLTGTSITIARTINNAMQSTKQ